MGNDVSAGQQCSSCATPRAREPSDMLDDWPVPPMVLYVDAVAVPPNEPDLALRDGECFRVSAAVDGVDVLGGLMCRIPAGPIEVAPRKNAQSLQLRFYRSQLCLEEETTKVYADVCCPISTLVRYGAPLYTSLWLGLSGEAKTEDMMQALHRARDGGVAKARLTLFKPRKTTKSKVPSEREKRGMRPDLEGGLKDAGIMEKDLWSIYQHVGTKNFRVAMVEGLIRCVEESHSVVQSLLDYVPEQPADEISVSDTPLVALTSISGQQRRPKITFGDLSEEVGQQTDDSVDLKEALEKQRKEIQLTQEELQQYRASASDLQMQKDAHEEEIRHLKEQVLSMQQEASAVKQKHEEGESWQAAFDQIVELQKAHEEHLHKLKQSSSQRQRAGSSGDAEEQPTRSRSVSRNLDATPRMRSSQALLKSMCDGHIQELRNSYRCAVEDVDRLKAQVAAYEEEIRTLRESGAQANDSSQLLQETYARLQDQHAEQERLLHESKDVCEQLRRERDEALERAMALEARAGEFTQQQELSRRLSGELERLHEENNGAQQRLEEQHEERLSCVITAHSRERALQQEALQSLSEQMARLKSEHVEELRSAQESSLETSTEHARVLNNMEEYAQRLSEQQLALQAREEEMEQAIRAHDQELRNLRDAHAHALQEERARAADQMLTQHNGEVEALVTAASDNHRSEMLLKEQIHRDELARLTKTHASELAQLQKACDRMAQQIAKLTEQHQLCEEQALTWKLQVQEKEMELRDKRGLDESLRAQQLGHEEELRRIGDLHTQQLCQQEQAYTAAEVKKLEEERIWHAAEVQRLREAHAEELNQQKETHRRELEHVTIEQDAQRRLAADEAKRASDAEQSMLRLCKEYEAQASLVSQHIEAKKVGSADSKRDSKSQSRPSRDALNSCTVRPATAVAASSDLQGARNPSASDSTQTTVLPFSSSVGSPRTLSPRVNEARSVSVGLIQPVLSRSASGSVEAKAASSRTVRPEALPFSARGSSPVGKSGAAKPPFRQEVRPCGSTTASPRRFSNSSVAAVQQAAATPTARACPGSMGAARGRRATGPASAAPAPSLAQQASCQLVRPATAAVPTARVVSARSPQPHPTAQRYVY